MSSSTNRRRHSRVKPKQLASRLATDTALHLGLAVDNISMGGLYVRCLQPMAAGTRVSLELTRPGSPRPIPVMGRVVSTVLPAEAAQRGIAPGMGIAFDELPPHIEVRIEGVVAIVDPDATRSREHAPLGEGVQLPTGSNPALRPLRTSGEARSGGIPALGVIPQGREIDVLRAALADREAKLEKVTDLNKVLREKLDAALKELAARRSR